MNTVFDALRKEDKASAALAEEMRDTLSQAAKVTLRYLRIATEAGMPLPSLFAMMEGGETTARAALAELMLLKFAEQDEVRPMRYRPTPLGRSVGDALVKTKDPW